MSKARVAAGLGAAAIALAGPIVASYEGLRTKPYLDPVGIPTVCYGETHAEMRTYTVAECQAMLMQSLEEHGKDIAACIPDSTPIQVKAASLSFGYNAGASKFCGSTMAKKIRARDYPGACAELSKWVYAGGKELPGLVKRRAAERAMCEGRAT